MISTAKSARKNSSPLSREVRQEQYRDNDVPGYPLTKNGAALLKGVPAFHLGVLKFRESNPKFHQHYFIIFVILVTIK